MIIFILLCFFLLVISVSSITHIIEIITCEQVMRDTLNKGNCPNKKLFDRTAKLLVRLLFHLLAFIILTAAYIIINPLGHG